jgi:hypothetical protein
VLLAQPGWLAVSAMISCLFCASASVTPLLQALSGNCQLHEGRKQYQL